MEQIKKIWCQYCLEKTPHRLISVTRVGNHIKKTFIDKLFKRNTTYYWECIRCGEKIRKRKRK